MPAIAIEVTDLLIVVEADLPGAGRGAAGDGAGVVMKPVTLENKNSTDSIGYVKVATVDFLSAQKFCCAVGEGDLQLPALASAVVFDRLP